MGVGCHKMVWQRSAARGSPTLPRAGKLAVGGGAKPEDARKDTAET